MNASVKPVAAIVVNFRTPDLAILAVHAMFVGDSVPEEIVVVDNGSADGSAEAISAAFGDRAKVIMNAENRGFGGANNQGIAATKAPYVWLVNSDAEAGPRTLSDICSFMDAHPAVGAVSPTLVYPDGRPQSPGGFFPGIWSVFLYFFPIHKALPGFLRQKMRLMAIVPGALVPAAGMPLGYVTGAALFARRDALVSAGGFDEDYFMYFEETDLCRRMQAAGFGIAAIRTDPVVHAGGGSFRHRHDARRFDLFVSGLRRFVRKSYRGPYLSALLLLIAACAPISVLMRRIFLPR